MGGAVKAVKNTFSNPVRGLEAIGTFGTSELARNNMGPLAGMVARAPESASDALLGTHYGDPQAATGAKGSPIYGTTLNPYGDQAQVQQLGQQAYDASTGQLMHNMGTFQQDQSNINAAGSADMAARSAARDQLANLLQQQAQQTLKMSLPQTAEDYNSGGLLNSTGYQQEVARQQANLASQISNQIAQQGLQDVNVGSQYRQAALNSQLGANDYYRTGTTADTNALNAANQAALQRQFSVTDFGNSANTASIIGAQNAPQVGNGKAGTGAMLSGAGALAKGVGGLK